MNTEVPMVFPLRHIQNLSMCPRPLHSCLLHLNSFPTISLLYCHFQYCHLGTRVCSTMTACIPFHVVLDIKNKWVESVLTTFFWLHLQNVLHIFPSSCELPDSVILWYSYSATLYVYKPSLFPHLLLDTGLMPGPRYNTQRLGEQWNVYVLSSECCCLWGIENQLFTLGNW